MAQRKEAEDRIGDFDKMSDEIMQVLINQHLANMLQKFRAKHYEFRRDAYLSARLGVALCYQILTDKKLLYRQFELTLGEVTHYYQKQKIV